MMMDVDETGVIKAEHQLCLYFSIPSGKPHMTEWPISNTEGSGEWREGEINEGKEEGLPHLCGHLSPSGNPSNG